MLKVAFAARHWFALPWSVLQRSAHCNVALKVSGCHKDLGAHCPVSCTHFYSTFSLLNLLAVEVPCRSHYSELQTLKLSPPLWQCTRTAGWCKQKKVINSVFLDFGVICEDREGNVSFIDFWTPMFGFQVGLKYFHFESPSKVSLRSGQPEGMLLYCFLNLDPQICD